MGAGVAAGVVGAAAGGVDVVSCAWTDDVMNASAPSSGKASRSFAILRRGLVEVRDFISVSVKLKTVGWSLYHRWRPLR